MKKWLKIGSGVLVGCVLAAAGILVSLLPPRVTSAKPRPQPTFNSNAWVASWDAKDGIKEGKQISSQLNSLSYFGGALDSEGNVIVLGPARQFRKEAFPRYKVTVKKYLTVVNDVYENPEDAKGQTKLKDTDLLQTLLADTAARKAHMDKLFAAVKEYGYDGLEIDYERVWRNPLVAYRYVKFIQELNQEAEEKKVPLRVILEPEVPANTLVFPEGPEYVIMAYNLYGLHTTKPGPKADLAFVDKVMGKVQNMPRPHSIAFATGGCVWTEGEKPRFVTEKEAVALRKQLKVKPQRDEKSQALVFRGKDKKGRQVEAWYADAQTLKAWKYRALQQQTDGISLWRLGGNERIKEYYPGMDEK